MVEINNRIQDIWFPMQVDFTSAQLQALLFLATLRNSKQVHAILCNSKQVHAILCNSKQVHAILRNSKQVNAILRNFKQVHAILRNSKQFYAIPSKFTEHKCDLKLYRDLEKYKRIILIF